MMTITEMKTAWVVHTDTATVTFSKADFPTHEDVQNFCDAVAKASFSEGGG